MKHMAKLLAVIAVLSASTAQAQTTAPQMKRLKFGTLVGGTTDQYKVLSGVALNATASTRTFTLTVSGWSKLTVQIDFTRSAATGVSATCTASLNGGASYASLTSTAVSSGAGAVAAYADTFPTSASTNFLLEYDVRTYDKIKCVLAGTSAGGSDLVTVYAVAAVGE